MNLLDIIILVLLILGFINGFRRGAIKQGVLTAGIFLVVILSFIFKNPLSIMLYKKLPFLLVKEENKLKLVLILYKKNSDLKSFENNLKKMLNNNLDLYNLGNENPNQFPSEFSFKLIIITCFDDIDLNDNNIELKTKIYSNISELNSIFISIFYNHSLIIKQIKFNKKIQLEEKDFYSVEHFKFDNIIDFHLIKSLISKNNQLLFDVRKNKNNSNECINLLSNFLRQNDIEYKTIVFLDKNNTLYFLEGKYVIFKYSLHELIPFNIQSLSLAGFF